MRNVYTCNICVLRTLICVSMLGSLGPLPRSVDNWLHPRNLRMSTYFQAVTRLVEACLTPACLPLSKRDVDMCLVSLIERCRASTTDRRLCPHDLRNSLHRKAIYACQSRLVSSYRPNRDVDGSYSALITALSAPYLERGPTMGI